MRVGRNASCEIHLPDPRIALEQGMIVNRDGLVYIEGEAGSQNITRKTVRSVRMKPGGAARHRPVSPRVRRGAPGLRRSDLGRARAPAGDRRRPRQPHGAQARSRRSASPSAPSRGLGALAILILYLVIPAGRVLDLPWRFEGARAGDRGPPLESGPRDRSRTSRSRKHCAACHEVAFRHVKNGACLECHAEDRRPRRARRDSRPRSSRERGARAATASTRA